MSRFFVGQRVRLVRPVHPQNAGLTGTIKTFVPEQAIGPFPYNSVVDWDSPAIGHYSHTSQLEPIYDGNEVVSWESMRDLWQPAEQGQPA